MTEENPSDGPCTTEITRSRILDARDCHEISRVMGIDPALIIDGFSGRLCTISLLASIEDAPVIDPGVPLPVRVRRNGVAGSLIHRRGHTRFVPAKYGGNPEGSS